MTAFHTKYRPTQFDEVWGQDAAVAAMRSAVAHKDSGCFLLSGGSGVGKTTLARIAARELGCNIEDPGALKEIDAAKHTGVEHMREIEDLVQYRAFGASGVRAVIIDECHRLSGNAWDSLLKATEEPPPDVYWFFCTTNPIKIPKTIVTRSLRLHLKEIDKNTLTDLVEYVAKEEHIKLPDAVRQLVVARAEGSARQALVNLAACREIQDRSEAAEVLQSVEESDEAIALMRMLASGTGDWTQAMKILNGMNGANPEAIRIQAVNYFAQAAKNARNDRQAQFFLDRVEAFATSYYNSSEAEAQLLRSIGRCIFRGSNS